jgi:hypothetical protein
VTLTFDDAVETTLTVYMPSLAFDAAISWAAWVALDGSLYYGKDDHGQGGFDQDSGFALAVDEDALAKGAYDGGGSPSPLINMASLDWLNDGYTNTNLTTADNSTTTADVLVPFITSGSRDLGDVDMGFMDIGYHYGGQLRHPSQIIEEVVVPTADWVSISGIAGSGIEWDAVHVDSLMIDPDKFLNVATARIDSHREFDLVSGRFSASGTSFGEDGTVAIFATEPYDSEDMTNLGSIVAIGAIPFRGTDGTGASDLVPAYISARTGRPGVVLPLDGKDWTDVNVQGAQEGVDFDMRDVTVTGVKAIAACTTPNRESGSDSAEGTMYAAAVFSHDAEGFAYDEIQVWRVDLDNSNFPDDTESSEPIPVAQVEFSAGGYGEGIALSSLPRFTSAERVLIHDVALCADNTEDGGLYVSWIEERPGAPSNAAYRGPRLMCQYVPDAAIPAGVTLGRDWDNRVTGTTIVENAFLVDGDKSASSGLNLHHAFITATQGFEIDPQTEQAIQRTLTNSIEADFDFDEIDSVNGDGQPRLIYFDFNGAATDAPVGPRQALLGLDGTTRQPNAVIDVDDSNAWLPSQFSISATVANPGQDAELLASLAVSHAANEADSDFENRAFANFGLSVGPDVDTQTYDLWLQPLTQSSGNDDWLAQSSGATSDRPAVPSHANFTYPDATWRFNGSPRVIGAAEFDTEDVGTTSNQLVSTDRERLFDSDGGEDITSSLYPHVSTNGENLVDTFGAFVLGSEGERVINIIQVDP